MRTSWILQSVAYGGMEVFVSHLATAIAPDNDVQVVIPPGTEFDEFADRVRASGARVERTITDGRAGRSAQLRGLLSLYRSLRRQRPQVVHLHTGGATGGLAVAALARLVPATVVLSEYDVPYEPPTRAHRLSRRALDRLCAAVLAVSERNVKLRAAAFGSSSPPVRVLEIGIPLGNRDGLRPPRQATPSEPPRFLSVCRLAEGKGIDDLLQAFHLVHAARPDATIELVGDGPLRAPLQQFASDLDLGDAVRFAGHRADPWIGRDGSEIFVLAVPAGSMSTALLEAMSRGMCAVITFAHDGEAVVPGVNGLAAPPNDHPALALALLQAAGDTALRHSLGLAAQRQVMSRFSIETAAQKLLDVYASVQRASREQLAGAPAEPDAVAER